MFDKQIFDAVKKIAKEFDNKIGFVEKTTSFANNAADTAKDFVKKSVNKAKEFDNKIGFVEKTTSFANRVTDLIKKFCNKLQLNKVCEKYGSKNIKIGVASTIACLFVILLFFCFTEIDESERNNESFEQPVSEHSDFQWRYNVNPTHQRIQNQLLLMHAFDVLFNTPTVTPSYNTPSYNTPSYNTPSYNTPSYNTPSYNTPSYNTPSYNTPSYNTPSSSSQTLKCSSHGISYSYGGCPMCNQADYGTGKTDKARCSQHGYWYDPTIGCPGGD